MPVSSGRFVLTALALSMIASAAMAGKIDKVCKRKDGSNRCVEWVAQTGAAEVVTTGARKLKDKAVNAAKREKNCQNSQGGNHANSTAAVRVC